MMIIFNVYILCKILGIVWLKVIRETRNDVDSHYLIAYLLTLQAMTLSLGLKLKGEQVQTEMENT
jgi:hypothetical protein